MSKEKVHSKLPINNVKKDYEKNIHKEIYKTVKE